MTGRTVAPTIAAPIGRRVGAYAIDLAIQYAIGGVLGGISVAILFALGATWKREALAAMVLLLWAIVAVVSLIWLVVYTAMQGGRGSLGQRARGIQIRDAASDAPIGFWRALLRNLVWALAGSIVVGYFSPLFDSSGRRQGWHDMASRSVVVDRKSMDAAASVPPPVPPAPVANPYLPPPAGAPAAGDAPVVPSVTGLGPAPAAPSLTPAARVVVPAAPIPSTGLISHVPGVAGSAPAAAATSAAASGLAVPAAPAAPAAPVPVPPTSGTAVAAPAPPTTGENVDETRAAASAPAHRADEAAAVTVLTWDDGTRIAVYGRTLFGRNPATEEGAARVAMRDETLSLSKTHFEIGGDAAGPWIIDRHSTNGSALVRNGSPQRLIAGAQTSLRPGDRLEFGDRSLEVGTS